MEKITRALGVRRTLVEETDLPPSENTLRSHKESVMQRSGDDADQRSPPSRGTGQPGPPFFVDTPLHRLTASEDAMTASSKISETADQAEKALKETEKTLRELVERTEKLLQEGLETLRAQSRTYADTAGESIDVAQRYVVERVQERPLTSTFAALGLGVLIGFVLSAGRDR
jgi:ElaB/YqjD/DUF883 family membrane-anchored ribosome-binding protein